MNSDVLKGEWKKLKGQAKAKWGELTDDEIEQARGEREQMVGLLQQKYGKAKEDAEQELDRLMSKL